MSTDQQMSTTSDKFLVQSNILIKLASEYRCQMTSENTSSIFTSDVCKTNPLEVEPGEVQD